jgi:hypothetical protein
MRRHPSLYNRDVYRVVRSMVEQHTGRSRGVLIDQRNEFPRPSRNFPPSGRLPGCGSMTTTHGAINWAEFEGNR